MAHLPRDLLDLLLDEFQSSSGVEATVAVCGLVCKAWLPSSRARLFAKVVLRERNARSFYHMVKKSTFPIQSLIRTLQVIVHTEDTFIEKYGSKLGPFPGVTTLDIEADIGKWIPEMADTFDFFPNKFPALSNLILSADNHTSFSTCDILFAVKHFPTLESFRISGPGFNPIDASCPEEYSIPHGWHTLELEMPMSGNFFETLFELQDSDGFDLPVFSSLSMQDAWPEGRSFIGRYLRNFGHQMKHLRFDCSDENMDREPAALEFCTGLRRLDLRIDTGKVPGTLLNILENLEAPALTIMNVMDPGLRTGRSLSRYPNKWSAVDKMLAGERFSNLGCLSFTGQPALKGMLEQSMPLCAARGIIQVVNI
ncbi:hypothetical protein DFH06DRAFT_1232682 [Mycena polygramma]|nr:hypothetical protein DFH06DRAFT_1232682 [Mycena polygramma]